MISINKIHKKYNLVPVTDEDHQLSADEFNAIVQAIKNLQSYLANVEEKSLSIRHSIPNNVLVVNTNDTEALLKFTPVCISTKTNTETEEFVTEELEIPCQITISSNSGTISTNGRTGKLQSVDIRSLLAVGNNDIEVTVQAGGETTGEGFTVTLTSLSLSENNLQWHEPFYSTDDEYQIGGFSIVGSIEKTVHIEISGNGYHEHYRDNIGRMEYSTNPYVYKLTRENFPNKGTGSYNVDVYVTVNNAASIVETQHIKYDILCIEESDRSSAKLIALKQPSSNVLNYASQTIAEYVVYDGTSTSKNTDIQIKVATLQDNLEEEILVYPISLNVPTVTNLTYKTELHYDGREYTKDARFTIEIGDQQRSFDFIIDNSSTVPPISGASFYLDPTNRFNSSVDKKSIINTANGTVFTALWDSVSFVDGVDGWTVDKEGIKALVLPAASICTINYQPLASAVQLTPMVFDFSYKVENVSDYTKPIITICDNPRPESNSNEVVDDQEENHENFVGIKIFPTKVLVHSNLKKQASEYDLIQGTNLIDEEPVNVQICMCPKYNINYGNFLIIYVNGVKKCEFAYNGSDESFQNDGNVIFGGDYADLYLYSFRVYDKQFNDTSALNNFYSSLHSLTEKQSALEEDQAIIEDSEDGYINLEKLKNTGKYNYFVVEPIGENAVLPAYNVDGGKGYSCKCNFEMHYSDKPTWDYYISEASLSGQGTTSMDYYVWNLRIKLDLDDEKYNTKVSTNGINFEPVRSVDANGKYVYKGINIDGGNHPAVKRITAKKNYASSMQSHKMGSTAAFNDLHDAVCGQNEANARTAVYQYPAYGFIKQHDERGQEIYKFIGLYTIGPDKGDKATFGYDGNYKKTLLSLEGLDHNAPLALFRYPWTDDGVLYHDKEKIGINTGTGMYNDGWEVSVGDDDLIEQLWKNAYKQVYSNSPFIIGVTQSIDSINNNISQFRSQKLPNDKTRTYGDYDIWNENERILYYYDLALKQYVPVKDNSYNLIDVYTDVADYIKSSEWSAAGTLQEKNDLIIKARVKRFKATMSDYWDVDDTLFHYCFVIMFAASDNFAKNTYPYNFGAFDSKWRWRQDDLDTLFDIDNYGRPTKGTSIEYEDITPDGTQRVFKGEKSSFWTLIHLAYEKDSTDDRLIKMCRNILKAMCNLGSAGESSVSEGYAAIMAFFQKYYFDKAEEYFTRSSYNIDAKNSYEDAFADAAYMDNKPVDPLSQSLGNHIEATKFWLSRRIIYLMSKYSFGEFSDHSNKSLGMIQMRPQRPISLTLVPAVDMYPTILSGQSDILKYSDRVFAGESATIDFNQGGSGDNTMMYIPAVDYIREIQGLQHLEMETGSNLTLSIAGKRLQRFDISTIVNGSEIENPTNITQLSIGKCPSLEYINATGVSTLISEMDLSWCPRLREAYFEDTNISGIIIPNGAKIQTLKLPASITSLTLRNLPDLQTFSIADTNRLSYIRIENTSNVFDDDVIFNLISLDQSGSPIRQTPIAIRIDNLDLSANNEKMNILYNYCLNAHNVLNYVHGINVNGDSDLESYPVFSGRIVQEDQGANTRIYSSSEISTIERVFPYINLVVQDIIVEFEDAGVANYWFPGNYTAKQLAEFTASDLRSRMTTAFGSRLTKFNEFKYFENIEEFSPSYFIPDRMEITLPENLIMFQSTSTGIGVFEKINLGKNQYFDMVGNCLMGHTFLDFSENPTDGKTNVHCIQGTCVKIPEYTTKISFFALANVEQNVLVIPHDVRISSDIDYYGKIKKAIIFETSLSTGMSFGLPYRVDDMCDIYIMSGGPINRSQSDERWQIDIEEHEGDFDNFHVYVPIGTKQQYVEYCAGHYPQELFKEFDPETDETFLSLMEEYNNMEV